MIKPYFMRRYFLFLILTLTGITGFAQQYNVEQGFLQNDSICRNKIIPFYHAKSPVLAGIFSSAIPGMGQVYNGEISKGLSFFVATCGIGFLGIESINKSPAAGTFNVAVALSLYAWNIIDAPRSAKKINQRKGIIDIHFKNSSLLVNPNIDCLHATNGEEISRTTNAGIKLCYRVGIKK
jgi:TM2 domain-containing membrane protein YozV